jgi:hypothetical protein
VGASERIGAPATIVLGTEEREERTLEGTGKMGGTGVVGDHGRSVLHKRKESRHRGAPAGNVNPISVFFGNTLQYAFSQVALSVASRHDHVIPVLRIKKPFDQLCKSSSRPPA